MTQKEAINILKTGHNVYLTEVAGSGHYSFTQPARLSGLSLRTPPFRVGEYAQAKARKTAGI